MPDMTEVFADVMRRDTEKKIEKMTSGKNSYVQKILEMLPAEKATEFMTNLKKYKEGELNDE